ncbi:MAG TPA: DUF6461 domain-containing protein [Kofleriaceae bacterium]
MRGKSRETILDELALRDTGAREPLAESPLVGAALADGWYVVLSNKDVRFADDDLLKRLSAGCELVGCVVEEHVMISGAWCWKNGEKMWSVDHDSQRSIEHLDTTGAVPAQIAGIRDRLLTDQRDNDDDVDIVFNAPLELAKMITGFSHDEDADGVTYEVLVGPATEKKPSWLQRLVGRT